ncbi:MAG: DUF1501 domain-containing protein, partial [Armatimonadetes bacterium]|nr:DUF1501 domain-containing protein [Armatimonadota bacterium]
MAAYRRSNSVAVRRSPSSRGGRTVCREAVGGAASMVLDSIAADPPRNLWEARVSDFCNYEAGESTMLNVTAEGYGRTCSGRHRRDLLRIGSSAWLGMTLADLFRSEASAAARPAHRRDKNCILLMLIGAPPQHDTWDPKPDQPENIRGPYRPIETNVSGIRISEILPRTARLADRYAILRSLGHSNAADHETGHQVIHTGHFFPNGLDYPHMGTVVSHLRGDRDGMPANVTLPNLIKDTGSSKPKGQDSGYLGRHANP